MTVQDISRLFRDSAYAAYGEKFIPCDINKNKPSLNGKLIGKPCYNKAIGETLKKRASLREFRPGTTQTGLLSYID